MNVHHVDELLGVVRGGRGPEATADAASHNNYLRIVVHFF